MWIAFFSFDYIFGPCYCSPQEVQQEYG